MDTHDISRGRGDFVKVLNSIQQPCLIIGIASDGLFTAEEQCELGDGIPNATVKIIESGEGHDGFLLEFAQIRDLIENFICTHTNIVAEDEKMCGTEIELTKSVFGEAEGDLLLW